MIHESRARTSDTRDARISWLIAWAAALVFAIYAASFLYFFVDDEAIPLVYARNLLQGHGLVYSLAEGRVEGYSDFLHVLWSAVVLACVRMAGLPRLTALHVGKAVSFAVGIGTILLVATMMRKVGASRPGRIAGLTFLALSGPLAVWSCSSLEAVPFAFLATALAGVVSVGEPRRAVLLALGVLLVLYRIDGFVYVGAILAGGVVSWPAERRRWLLTHVVLPLALLTVAYQVARFVYFGSLLSSPLEAKVLYKLRPAQGLIVKSPERTYLRGFIGLYGLAAIPALGAAVFAAWRSRPGRGLIVATVIMATYIGTVGDWMFGWRFCVPLVPLMAVAIAVGVTSVRSRASWVVVAIVCTWSVVAAHAFAIEYTRSERKPIWWTTPHAGQAVWLRPYGELIPLARRMIAPGETIAYNQAGLLPFVLDVENIDDLGIVSRFESGLPTTDVYFTEVGRYSPMTPAPVFGAPHAYLLYRDVRTLISRTDLLTRANGGRIPPEVMGGYFVLAALDGEGENALYVRTNKPADAYRRDPSLFQENLAHTSRIRRVDLDGVRVPNDRVASMLPFLRWGNGSVDVRRTSRLDIRFAEHDEDVAMIYAASLTATEPIALTVNLYNEAGRLVASEDARPDKSPAPLLRHVERGTRARLLSLEMRAAGGVARLTISDLRINGQSAALADYVRRLLVFPAR